MKILGIDPGLKGALVLFDGVNFESYAMPLFNQGKKKDIHFQMVRVILENLERLKGDFHIYLERAMSMGMGSTGAFNYGRGFAALEIAIQMTGLPVTYVEPQKWAKVMHEGIHADLKPKAKSIIAIRRLFPKLVSQIPKAPRSGKLDEGVVDALLLAGYGYRMQKGEKPKNFTDEN